MNKRQRKKRGCMNAKELRRFNAGIEKRIKAGYDK